MESVADVLWPVTSNAAALESSCVWAAAFMSRSVWRCRVYIASAFQYLKLITIHIEPKTTKLKIRFCKAVGPLPPEPPSIGNNFGPLAFQLIATA